MTDTFTLPGVATPFTWGLPPVATVLSGGGLSVTAGGGTDLFADPGGEPAAATAPYAELTPPDGDFTFVARVQPQLADTYDAGCLLLLVDDHQWAKLACERSPQGAPMVVSVVTRGRSDDANGETLSRADVWLRVARVGEAFAFHASTDGATWHFVRHFGFESAVRVRVAISVQSPAGGGCTATFSDARLTRERIRDLRDGS